MKVNAYSVYDRKALVYSPPFYAATDGAATRMVQDTALDNNTSLARHPGDYVLYRVGSYDDGLGLLTSEQPLVHVVDVLALVNAAINQPLPLEMKV